MKIRTTLLAAVLAAAAVPAHAQLHKWVGPDGKVHYSDKPPPDGAKVQPLEIRNDAPPPGTQPHAPARSMESSRLLNQAAAADARAQNEERAMQRQREQEEFTRRRCDNAMAAVRRAIDMPAVRGAGRGGDENNLGERTARINQAKASARATCGDKYQDL